LLALVAAVPVGASIGVWAWAKWLAKRTSAPRLATLVGYAIAVASGVPMMPGFLYFIVSVGRQGGSQPPSVSARVLAEGISEVMNCGALAVLIALAGYGWLLFCTVRWRRRR
jgi:hypothetical protein